MRTPRYKIVLVCLSLATSIVAGGCDSELFDDQIYPIDETREPCYEEPETWRCNGEVAELCRNGFWNPWYNCAWNGGTCEQGVDEYGVPIEGAAGCVDPADQAIQCDTDIWDSEIWTFDSDPNTDDTDTGYDTDTSDTDTALHWDYQVWLLLEQTCMMCQTNPTDPADFADAFDGAGYLDPLPDPEDIPVAVNGPTDGVLGCCSVEDGNAYWGEDTVVLQHCTNGCCAYIDYTSTLDDPSPVYHACCPE